MRKISSTQHPGHVWGSALIPHITAWSPVLPPSGLHSLIPSEIHSPPSSFFLPSLFSFPCSTWPGFPQLRSPIIFPHFINARTCTHIVRYIQVYVYIYIPLKSETQSDPVPRESEPLKPRSAVHRPFASSLPWHFMVRHFRNGSRHSLISGALPASSRVLLICHVKFELVSSNDLCLYTERRREERGEWEGLDEEIDREKMDRKVYVTV